MFYLLKDEQIRTAETFDTAARLVSEGWELTTHETYRAWWQYYDLIRLEQLKQAARCVPLLERTT